MKGNKRQDKMQKFISLALTLTVIGLLILAGPAAAISVGIVNLPPEADEGSPVSFDAVIDLHTNDVIPLRDITVTMTDNLGETYKCSFDVKGHKKTCDPLFGTISCKSKLRYVQQETYGYGYGYQYGYQQYGYGYYGYGYGYGYSSEYGYGYGYFPEYGYGYGYTPGYGYGYGYFPTYGYGYGYGYFPTYGYGYFPTYGYGYGYTPYTYGYGYGYSTGYGYSPGYGYGYGYIPGYGYGYYSTPFNYGYGYQYGYGYDTYTPQVGDDGEVVCNVELNTPSVSADKTYYLKMSVRANDGSNVATYNGRSVPLLVKNVNVPPTAPLVTASPSPAAYTVDDLTCSASGSIDADGDPVSYEYRWYKDSILTGYPNPVSNADTFAGNVWRCEARAFDGVDYSAWVSSGDTTVIDTPPTAPNVIVSPSPTAYTADDLTCSASGSTDADGDAISYEYRWYKDSILTGYPNPVSNADTFAGNVWKCEARASANGAFSSWVSDETTIINTPPTSPAVILDPVPTAYDSTDLFCGVSGSTDADGDIIGYEFAWYRNSVLQGAFTSSLLDDSNTIPGEVWNCEARAFDGSDYSAPVASLQTTIIADPVPEEPSGGSSGGCMTEWVCSDWSPCVDGTQTRTCEKEKSYCYVNSGKPSESQSCTPQPSFDVSAVAACGDGVCNAALNENADNCPADCSASGSASTGADEAGTDGEDGSLGDITGQAISDIPRFLGMPMWLLILIILALLGGVVWFFWPKK